MGQMEHLLNVYASKAAKGSIADFVGYVEVADEEATTRLTQGTWLVSNKLPLTHAAILKTFCSTRSTTLTYIGDLHHADVEIPGQ